jgi:hypothetical protein
MKFFAFALCFFFLPVFAFSQQIKTSHVPDAVLKAFSVIHPKIHKVQWMKMEDGYRGSFFVKGVKNSELIDSSGNWLDSREDVTPEYLPDSVRINLRNHFPGVKIDQAMRVIPELPDSDYTFWYIRSGNKYYIFDEIGDFLRTEDEEKPAEGD